MDEIVLLNRIISNDRIQPYLNRHSYMLNKAIRHYQSNILISESFYPLLALLEVGLRNSMDYQLTKLFNDRNWYDNRIFHHEAISWNLTVLESYKNELLEGIEWLDGDLLIWAAELNHVSETIEKYRSTIE